MKSLLLTIALLLTSLSANASCNLNQAFNSGSMNRPALAATCRAFSNSSKQCKKLTFCTWTKKCRSTRKNARQYDHETCQLAYKASGYEALGCKCR